jgi:peptidyl-prolyl cis-trans isomerase A (cyclophilin A)
MKKIILSILLSFFVFYIFAEKKPASSLIMIKTELGNITVEIYTKKAPITAKNFIIQIKKGIFKNSSIFRTVTMDNQPNNKVKIEVVQGGPNRAIVKKIYGKDFDFENGIKHETTKATGILHKDGVISMARGKPGTAFFSYFICINDQPSLDYGGKRNSDGQGFAAFGKVIKGMDIIRKIQNSPHKSQNLTPAIKVYDIVIIN